MLAEVGVQIVFRGSSRFKSFHLFADKGLRRSVGFHGEHELRDLLALESDLKVSGLNGFTRTDVLDIHPWAL